jgi:molybdopterin/thiamine biosynthesis adenylyltransferase/nitroreductase
MPQGFDYLTAFSRNLGWTTEWEQLALRARTVAIAGLGGVGGAHLLALARLGIGGFHIADLDRFDLANMNRQAGARMDTLGRPKVDVLAEMALAINPTLRLNRFPEGVTDANLDRFLEGCDLFVDGLDFFVLPLRARVFARCAALGIPALTAAPIGMGTGFLAFLPGGMSFESYFRLEGHSEEEQYLRFLMGMAPAGLHRPYLADPSWVDLAGRRGPSTVAACELCAGMVATQALKLLLGRGGVPAAPDHLHFDAYRGLLARTRLRWGNAGPGQRARLAVARRIYRAMAARAAAQPPTTPQDPILAILDLARWAPSGDNEQPWRFERLDDGALRIHLAAPDPANPYEYRGGEPILLAGGMLLESLRIAASTLGHAMDWTAEPDGPPWRLDVRLRPASDVVPSPLAAALTLRSVARAQLGTTPLTDTQRHRLAAALGPDLAVEWHESRPARLRLGRLGMLATDIRLRTPEAFAVHRRVLDWQRPRSPAGIPVGALGLDAATLALMRWAMRDWRRLDRLNRTIGTLAAAFQMDLRPALASAAFFVIRPARPADPPALLHAGEALQRFWLTATELGLGFQPALATLIFADHGARGTEFSAAPGLAQRAATLAERFRATLGDPREVVFMGRLGAQPPGIPGPRSVRRPLDDLMQPGF